MSHGIMIERFKSPADGTFKFGVTLGPSRIAPEHICNTEGEAHLLIEKYAKKRVIELKLELEALEQFSGPSIIV